jgi:5-oxopent-3-ene-1,2,5-tricarboxylate decarboxylase / 2-hydroxyhepta-2,4-diene-1,7-dioate isomerase
MFPPVDHLIHVYGEPLACDRRADEVRALLSRGVACAPPISGTVYGTLLNDAAALAALGEAVHLAPYKAPPQAPVLYIKPRNTHVGHGARVAVPHEARGIEVGASLGIVIGRTASRVSAENAFEYIGGYTIVADLSVPHESVYRPSVRFRARDGFCVMGPAVVARRHVANPDALDIVVEIDGGATFRASTATSIRHVAGLISDVTDFMTLSPGDVLTLGVPHGMPVVGAGAAISIAIGDWPPLRCSTIAEGESR